MVSMKPAIWVMASMTTPIDVALSMGISLRQIHRPVVSETALALMTTRGETRRGGGGERGPVLSETTGLCVWHASGAEGRVGGVGEFGADGAEGFADGGER